MTQTSTNKSDHARPTLTLCMIVRDVAAYIVPCLRSIAAAVDEYVIVDTGSEDDTLNVLRDYFSKSQTSPYSIISDFQEKNLEAFTIDDAITWAPEKVPGPYSGKLMLSDFAAARNAGWSIASSDYVMWLDSDDIVLDAEGVRRTVDQMDKDGVQTAFVTYDYDHDADNRPTLSFRRERIVKRRPDIQWVGVIHEVIASKGPEAHFDDFKVIHRRRQLAPTPKFHYRNLKLLLREYKKEIDAKKEPDPRLLFYLGSEIRFLDQPRARTILAQFLDGSGWGEERAMAHILLGEMDESKPDLDNAFLHFAAATTEFPSNPDGLFGAARVHYYKAIQKEKDGRERQNDWHKVILYTEKAFAIADNPPEPSRHSFNPFDRQAKPLPFLSKAYIEVGRVEDGLAAARKALTFFKNDIAMLQNVEICEKWLGISSQKEPTSHIVQHILLDDPIDAPPSPTVSLDALAAFSIQLWKQLTSEPPAALRLLNSLPPAVKSHKKIHEAFAISASAPPPRKKLSVVIWTGPAWERWSPKSLETGLGGSENATIYMARELSALGHRVRVFSECQDLCGLYDGVEYVHYQKAYEKPRLLDCDVFVLSRQPWALDLNFESRANIMWVHDTDVGTHTSKLETQIFKLDKILCLSKWHRNHFLAMYPWIHPDIIDLTRNGLDLRLYEKECAKKNILLYSSSANRGLPETLRYFSKVKEKVKDAELHIYYGFDTWSKIADIHNDNNAKAEIQHYKNLIDATEGAVLKGRVGQRQLAQAQSEAKILAYATGFTETFCITALEAQAAGVIPVTTRLAALEETVKVGTLIPGPPNTPEYEKDFVSECCRLLLDDDYRTRLSRTSRQRVSQGNHDWSDIALEWDAMFSSIVEKKKNNPLAPYGHEIEAEHQS